MELGRSLTNPIRSEVKEGGGGSGSTNLSYTASPTNGIVTSDTGDDATIPAADETNAGLMLPAEKTKLAGLTTETADLNFSFDAINKCNPEFIVFASCIPKLSNSYVYGQAMQWEILNTAGHASSFFESVQTRPDQFLQVNYPTVKKVIYGNATPDGEFSGSAVHTGCSVDMNYLVIPATRTYPDIGVRLTGNGTVNWTNSHPTYLTAQPYDNSHFGIFGSGLKVEVNSAGFPTTYLKSSYSNELNVRYIGSNNYRIRYNINGADTYTARFIMVDCATGADILTPPTSSDIILVSGIGMYEAPYALNTFNNSNIGITTSHNFWVFGIFELFLIAKQLTSTSNLVKWQNDTGGSINIYRDTQSSFATKVLIYSGNASEFTDSGLTADTQYYYQMTNSSDVEISHYRLKTKK